MHCPACRHKKTRIIRTQPDAEFSARDLVRQCRNPACLAVFTSREALVSVLENSSNTEVVRALASRIDALAPEARSSLFKIIQVE